jgi:hypothetical protein
MASIQVVKVHSLYHRRKFSVQTGEKRPETIIMMDEEESGNRLWAASLHPHPDKTF